MVRLSTPLPIVALPCGSRSTRSTRRPARARAAARLTLVVVLPTPPFWLTTASTCGTSAIHATKHEVARRVHQRRLERDHMAAVAAGGHALQLAARQDALHRREDAAGRDQMPAGREESREFGEGARDHDREACRRLPLLDASLMYIHVRQSSEEQPSELQ